MRRRFVILLLLIASILTPVTSQAQSGDPASESFVNAFLAFRKAEEVERGGNFGILGALGGAGGGTLVGLGAGVGAAGKTKAGDGCEGGGDKATAVENDLLGEVLAHGRTPFSIKSLAVE